ncbi:hypothetical protein lpari_03500 [Legionella parisiensis]|uniref:Uncharacterized protein n=2 Tax=Legionella parisiensis TaxID=45071 RepID=A0A1E5JMF1_9GAMM|nr:hypothetical protein lpari_03500 [Legionella parisiensis]
MQSLRLQCGLCNLELVDIAILERGGKISFQIKRSHRP